MDIITLRNVGSFEIPDTYRSILRISPNNGNDDPSDLLTSANNAKIKLSTSEGTLLPLTFVSKKAQCEVVERENDSIELINIAHEYNKLFVSKSLNIKPTLYIEPNSKKIPLIFVNDSNSLGYPFEAPVNTSYFNHNNKLGFDSKLSIEENIKQKLTPSDYSKISESEKISINGEPVYRYINAGNGEVLRVQDFNHRTSVFGVYPGNTYPQNAANADIHDLNDETNSDKSGLHTQLSYLPLDTIIWKCLERSLAGVRRNYEGHYFNLSKGSSNALGKQLFGDEAIEDDIKDKAPIVNFAVQSGTIHYNAIPAHRYFFHTLRRYKEAERNNHLYSESGSITGADVLASNAMNTLCRHYALCDGKDIKTAYPNLQPINYWSAVHEAIGTSMDNDASTFKTPPLFELNQYAPRFIRGLNWIPIEDEAGNIKFKNNAQIYKKVESLDDAANHKKDINQVGAYYANYDYDLPRTYEHGHALLSFKSFVGDVTSLNTEADIFQGKENTAKLPKAKQSWINYVNGNSETFLGSQMLKTAGSLLDAGEMIIDDQIRKIQNAPIANMGDTHDYFFTLQPCIKYAKKRKLGKCYNHKQPCANAFSIRDGSYIIARNNPDKEIEVGKVWTTIPNVWRLTSSLPAQNKYGETNDYTLNNLSHVAINAGGESDNIIYIDDSLPTPPAMNFIPLIKI